MAKFKIKITDNSGAEQGMITKTYIGDLKELVEAVKAKGWNANLEEVEETPRQKKQEGEDELMKKLGMAMNALKQIKNKKDGK